MVGLDAAEITFIREHHDSLPNLRDLIIRGQSYEVFSSAGLLPGSVWPSFYTGNEPAQHGFYLIMGWDAEAMSLKRVTPDRLPLEPFWYELANQGVKVIAIDVPMTHPPAATPSIEINGWGTHQGLAPFSTNPPQLASDLRAHFGQNSLGPEAPVDERDGDTARRARIQVKDWLIASAQRKAELIKWIASRNDWDLLIAVFGEAHRGGHVLWPSDGFVPDEWLLGVYRAVDDAFGEVTRVIRNERTTIGVFALHGMGSNNAQKHFMQPMIDLINQGWRKAGTNGGVKTSRSILPFVRARLPKIAKTAIARHIPLMAKDYVINRLYAAGRDWSTTPAIAVKTDGNGYIRLNVKGRERQGMLDQSNLNAYLSHLRDGLESFQTEWGFPIVEKIVMRADASCGPKAELLPDIIVTWKDQLQLVDRIKSSIYGQIEAAPDSWRGGYHRERGFLAFVGDAEFRTEHDDQRVAVTEFPTIIRTLLRSA